MEYANFFWDTVEARGGKITAAQTYNPKETDFNSPIKRLVGTFFIKDRLAEYKLRLKNWYKKQRKIHPRLKPPKDLLPPIVDFEALFIPDSVKNFSQIAATLKYHDIDDVLLLGTNLWNTPSLIEKAKKMADGVLFVDSFSHKEGFQKTSFYKEYKKMFGRKPSFFEAQTYDIGLILRQFILSGSENRQKLALDLAQMKAFPGTFGPISTNDHRDIHNKLETLTVQKGQIIPFSENP